MGGEGGVGGGGGGGGGEEAPCNEAVIPNLTLHFLVSAATINF